jgi:hypothetical protein
VELEAARAEIARPSVALTQMAVKLTLVEGKTAGLSGRIPRRVDAATKAGLLDLVDRAVEVGWSVASACRALELGELRAWRWLGRRAGGVLVPAGATFPQPATRRATPPTLWPHSPDQPRRNSVMTVIDKIA